MKELNVLLRSYRSDIIDKVNELAISINANEMWNSFFHHLILLVNKVHLWKGTSSAQFYIKVQISSYSPSSPNFLIVIFYLQLAFQ